MPFTPEKRKEYDRNRTDRNKAAKTQHKNVYFPMRISENVLAAANQIAAQGILTGKYPYRTAPEVIRACIAVGLKHVIHGDDDTVDAEVTQLIGLEQHASAMSRNRRLMTSVLESHKTEITALLDIGDKNAAAQFYASTMEEIEKTSRTAWSDWLHRGMKEAFPALDTLYENDEIPASSIFKRRPGARGSAKNKKSARRRTK